MADIDSKEHDVQAQPDAFLAWRDIEPNTAAWHKQSIQYLSQIWPRISSRKASNSTWGDEVECQIVHFEHKLREVRPALKQKQLLEQLPSNGVFQPEFARYMIETTPSEPYTDNVSSLLTVEQSLEARRRQIMHYLPENEKLMTLSVFPLLGTEPLIEVDDSKDSKDSSANFDNGVSEGQYSLAKENIEARSNRSADIKVPVYRDTCTKLPNDIHLGHILFGPGGCGLQATFQCSSLSEARILHDQLIVLGPIFLALTAATPIYAGVLVDTDVRWNQTAMAVDDRAKDEVTHLAERWSTAPMYLRANQSLLKEKLHPSLEKRVAENVAFLTSHGMDPIMSSYFAQLHLRDPLYLSGKSGDFKSVTPEAVHKSICASVWSHVRLKLPEPDEKGMGWRVEFRPMEVQLTDFANAAFLVFLDLIRQMLWRPGGKGLEMWMPLELVRDNMSRAHKRDAVNSTKLWFPVQGSPIELDIGEIVNGGKQFSGLMPLVESFLDATVADEEQGSRADLNKYLDFIKRRASGRELTPAQWTRRYVQNHKDYKKDSVVSSGICYDMLQEVVKLNKPC